jgi:hypothetical protein
MLPKDKFFSFSSSQPVLRVFLLLNQETFGLSLKAFFRAFTKLNWMKSWSYCEEEFNMYLSMFLLVKLSLCCRHKLSQMKHEKASRNLPPLNNFTPIFRASVFESTSQRKPASRHNEFV